MKNKLNFDKSASILKSITVIGLLVSLIVHFVEKDYTSDLEREIKLRDAQLKNSFIQDSIHLEKLKGLSYNMDTVSVITDSIYKIGKIKVYGKEVTTDDLVNTIDALYKERKQLSDSIISLHSELSKERTKTFLLRKMIDSSADFDHRDFDKTFKAP